MTSTRQSKYDGRTVFLPDVSKLRAGDIVLTRNAEGEDKKGLLQARAVRRFSRGRFDHALICSCPPTCIEALGVGVKTLSLQTTFAHDLENVRVLRCPDEVAAARAAAFAQYQVGRDYSVPKAMASIFPASVVDEIADRGIFCSALVAQAFIDADAEVFRGVSVNKTTPASLDHLEGLEDITATVFQGKLAPNNVERMVPLDGPRPASSSLKQTEINNRYARILSPLAETIVRRFPTSGLERPETFFECLSFICDAIGATARIPDSEREAFVAAVAAFDDEAYALFARGELEGVMRSLIKIDEAEHERNLRQSYLLDPDVDRGAMRNLLATTRTQIASRDRARAELITLTAESSRAIQAYCDLEAAMIEALQRRVQVLKDVLGRIGDTDG